MNTSWGNENFNNMGMPMNPMMMGNMGMPMNPVVNPMPPNVMANMGMMPPMGMMNEWGNNVAPAPAIVNDPNFIGPIVPEEDKNSKEIENKNTADRKSDNKARDRSEIGRGRSSDHSRDRNDRNGRDKFNRDFRRHDRRSKWDRSAEQNKSGGPPNMHNSNMPPNMLLYNQQAMAMDMMNMSNMPNMPNMPLLPTPMGNMGVVQPMMMNQMLRHQPIYISNGILLPPIPGVQIPNRREKPAGCRTIFVVGLPETLTVQGVHEVFQRFGSIMDVKVYNHGCCVQFEKPEAVDLALFLSGFRYKTYNQQEGEATTIFIDYGMNRNDHENHNKRREPSPPKIEPCSVKALTQLTENIKKDTEFANVAPTLAGWLERGECNKKNANTFYSLIQIANNHIHRLYNEKMQIDEEFQTLKATIKEKFAHVILQFEQVAKILSVAKHQRVSDHFSKQQRRNVEIWLKMTEDLENMKEEFNTYFDEEDSERPGKDMVSLEKYEAIKAENIDLLHELEGYKNEAHLAKSEAERKFETFKAHFIAQQALENKNISSTTFPPVPPLPTMPATLRTIPTHTEEVKPPSPPPSNDAKLISLITAYLLSHPLGATLDNIVAYLQSLISESNQTEVLNVLKKYTDLFEIKIKDGARWSFVAFDRIKNNK